MRTLKDRLDELPSDEAREEFLRRLDERDGVEPEEPAEDAGDE